MYMYIFAKRGKRDQPLTLSPVQTPIVYRVVGIDNLEQKIICSTYNNVTKWNNELFPKKKITSQFET